MKKGTNKHSISKWKHKLLIGLITSIICISGANAKEIVASSSTFYLGGESFGGNLTTVNSGSGTFYHSVSTQSHNYNGAINQVITGIHTTDWFNFINKDYVYFVVNSQFMVPSGASMSNGAICEVSYSGAHEDLESETTNSYWAVMKCNTSGVTSGATIDLTIYYNYNSDATGYSSSNISKDWYFTSESIEQNRALQSIINELKGINTDIDTIIPKIDLSNETLTKIFNKLLEIYVNTGSLIWHEENQSNKLNEQIEQNEEQIEEQQETNTKLDEQTQQDKEQHDEFMNSDLSEEDKQKPNQDGFDSYQESENELKDKMEQADLNNVSIGIDANSSSWVWNTLTSLIQCHSVVFGMFIAILSIGIIKLALGR